MQDRNYDSPATQPPPSMFRALQHRNFRLFFIGQIISLTGTWMQTMALGWLVYRLTKSPALLGAVGFASQIPIFFFSTWAGIVADRYSRHRIIVVTQISMMLQALVLAALTLLGIVQVWHIFALAVFLGLCNAVDVPARQSFLVEMVGARDLTNAIALNSSVFNGARMVGPAVAGVLVAELGEGLCFLINGLSYLAVIAGLLMMSVHPPQSGGKADSTVHQFKEGVAYAYHHTAIRSLLLLLSTVSIMGMSYAVLMPVFAEGVLRSGPRGMGGLMTAAGTGALLGALWLARRRQALGLDRVLVKACAGFGVFLILFAVMRSYWPAALFLLLVGFCSMVQMASTNSLVQSLVDNAMRGRIMGLYATMFMGVAPFGSLLSGFLAERLGAPAAVTLGGISCILGAGILRARLPALNVDGQLRAASEAGRLPATAPLGPGRR